MISAYAFEERVVALSNAPSSPHVSCLMIFDLIDFILVQCNGAIGLFFFKLILVALKDEHERRLDLSGAVNAIYIVGN